MIIITSLKRLIVQAMFLVSLLPVLGNSAMAQDITTGLFAHYSFDGNATDAQASGFDGTLTGGPTLVAGFDGTANAAYSFDGVDDKIAFGDLPIDAGSFTISYWLKMPTSATTTDSYTVLSKREGCSTGRFFELNYFNSATNGYGINTEIRDFSLTGSVNTGANYPVSPDNWAHIVFVKNNVTSRSTYYVNGAVIADASWNSNTLNLSNSASLVLGLSPCNGTGRRRFKGSIDDLRIYTRVLTALDIQALQPPILVSTHPASGADSIAASQVVSMSYNRNINAATVNNSNIVVTGDISGTLSPALSVSNDSIFITPTTGWAYGETITVNYQNIQSTDADVFSAGSFSFVVTSSLVSTHPSQGDDLINETRIASLKFIDPVDAATVNSTNVVVTGSTSGTLSPILTISNDSIYIAPSTSWPFGETITVVFQNIQSTGANTFSNGSFSFKTISEGLSNVIGNSLFILPLDGNGDDVDGGTITMNATLYGSPATIPNRHRTPGKAIRLDGVNDDIRLASNSDYFSSDEFTMTMWVKPEANIVNSMLFYSYKNTGNCGGDTSPKDAIFFNPRRNSNGRAYFFSRRTTFCSGGSYSKEDFNLEAPSNDPSINQNEWNMITVTRKYDGTVDSVKVFKNGQLWMQARTINNPIINASGITRSVNYFGRYTSGNFFKGGIDDIQYFESAMPDADVMTKYNEEKPVFMTAQVVSPTQNHGFSSAQPSFDITFSEPVDANDLLMQTKLIGTMSGSIDVNITMSGNTATISAIGNLLVGEKVELRISENVQSIASVYLKSGLKAEIIISSTQSPDYPSTLFGQDSIVVNGLAGDFKADVADLDGDGDIDLVTFSKTAQTITWYENDGNGNFTAHSISTIAQDIKDFVLTDMDLDGDMDIVANYLGHIYLHLNDGSGGFDAGTSIKSGMGNRLIKAADVNGDAYPDFVFAGIQGTTRSFVYLNNGDNTISLGRDLGIDSFDAEFFDYDQDGDLDIIRMESNQAINTVWNTNDGFGAFSSEKSFVSLNTGTETRPLDFTKGDMNGDGLEDFIISGMALTAPSRIYLYTANGGSSYTRSEIDGNLGTSSNFNLWAIRTNTADIDGDGDLDVIFISSGNKLNWIENLGVDGFAPRVQISNTFIPQYSTSTPIAADLNGDGVMEIIVASSNSLRYFTIKDKLAVTATTPVDSAVSVLLNSVITVTFDKALDLTSITAATVNLRSSKHVNGNADRPYTTSYANEVLTITPDADFFSDEVVTVTLSGLLAVDGNDLIDYDFSFNTFEYKGIANYPTRNSHFANITDSVAVKFNGVLDQSSATTNNFELMSQERGKLDGTIAYDGDSTMYFIPSTSFLYGEQITVYYGSGDLSNSNITVNGEEIIKKTSFQFYTKTAAAINAVSFTPSQLSNASGLTDASEIIAGDFDDDGDLDIVFTVPGGFVTWWVENLNGAGSFSAQENANSNTQNFGAHTLHTADMTKDGGVDLVLGSKFKSGQVLFNGWYDYQTNGSWNDHLVQPTSSGTTITSIEAMDINLDGYMDILSTNANQGEIYVTYTASNGSRLNASRSLSTPAGPLRNANAGDMDNDGDIDLVISTGNGIYYYENDGNSTFSSSIRVGQFTSQKSHLVDINQDGYLDIIYVASASTFILINDQQGDFLTEVTININTVGTIIDIKTGDIDGDGDIDIAVSYDAVHKLFWAENDGSENFTSHEIGALTSPRGINLSDIDGDGDLDLLAVSGANGGHAYWYKNGAIENNTPPVIDNPVADITINEDDAATVLVADITTVFSDPESDALTYSVASSTANVTVTLSGNEVTILAAENFFGVADITITANDGNSAIDDVVAVTVTSINDLPEVTTALADVTVDEDFADIIIGLGNHFSDLESFLTYTVTSTNSAINVNIVSEELTISSVTNAFGTGDIIVIANDGEATISDTLSITVNSINDAPIITYENNISVNEDFTGSTSVSVNLVAAPSNESSETITYSIAPATVTFATVNFNTATGDLDVTAIANEHGTQTFTITADDGQETNNTGTATVSVEVTAINDAPDFTLDNGDITIAKNFSGTLSQNITDLSPTNESGQTITYSISPSSATFVNVAFNSTTGEVTFTAIASLFGSESFTITANDGQVANNTASGSFTLAVLDNLPPTVDNPIADLSIDEDAASLIVVNDLNTIFSDPESNAITYSATTNDANLTATLSGTELSIAVATDYFGVVEVTVTATDGNNPTDETFTVTVNSVNDAPILSSFADVTVEEDFTTTESSAVSVTGPSNENDQLATLTYTLSPTTVAFANVNFDATLGTVEFTAIADMSGSQTFIMTVDDGQAENSTSSISLVLTVNAVNDAPVASAISDITNDEDFGSFTIDLDNHFSDVDDATLTYSITNNSPAVTTSIDGTILTIESIENANGSGNIEIVATDGSATASAAFSMIVDAVNDAPTVALIADQTTVMDAAITNLIVTVSDLETAFADLNITFSSDNEALFASSAIVISTSGSDNVLTITPTAGQLGEATITMNVSDGELTAQRTFIVTVSALLGVKDDLLDQSLSIYPNPAQHTLNIVLNDNKYNQYNVSILSLSGRVIINKQFNNDFSNANKLNISTLGRGIYLLKIKTKDAQITKRIVKK